MIKGHLFKKNDTKLNCLRIIFGFGTTKVFSKLPLENGNVQGYHTESKH